MSNKHLKEIETPFFVVNRSEMKDEIMKIKESFVKHWENSIIAYSVKTNSFPPLASFFAQQGLYAEVVSEDEYDLILKAGFEKSKLVVNGPVKSYSFVEKLLLDNTIINIDSKRELDYIHNISKKYASRIFRVGIRVNLDIEGSFQEEKNANISHSRFGFCFENGELGDAIERLQTLTNVEIVGLHLHRSTKTRSLEIYRWLVVQFSEIVLKYKLVDISYLDIGGGFYGGLPNKPNWDDYVSSISGELRKQGFKESNLCLIIEPGVSLLAKSMSYYCSAIDVKKTLEGIIITFDGSRIHIDPQMHKEEYFYELIKKDNNTRDISVDSQILCGFTCLEKDRFFTLHDEEPLRVGDRIKFDKVGAYTLTFTPLFISYFPAVYAYQESSNELELLRAKWTADEVIQLS